jgi:glycosyltransferase involved in cell wall biosynthesis
MIVDDGSTDNSWNIIQSFTAKDNRVRAYRRDREPKGACSCRNIAVEKSTGEYLLFLDTDDLLSSFCLTERVNAMNQEPSCDFIIFPMLLFNKKPDDLKLLWNINTSKDDIEQILMGNPVCQGTGTLWKKNSFVNVGMWDEQLFLWQDIELHLRSLLMGLKYKKRFDLEPDVFLRISDISLSRTGYHALPKLLSRWRVCKQTIHQINQQGLMHRYQRGLQFMFTDIYMNAVNSRYGQQIQEMLAFLDAISLFNKNEMRNFRRYRLAHTLRLYKVPFIFTYFQKSLMTNHPMNYVSIGKVKYQNEIKL